MMRHSHLEHRFVQYVPGDLEPGVFYVSLEYKTCTHCCCCGCGEEVVTPLGPTDWKMIFDGETISMHPSVGNWNLACRSHYVIERGRIIEAAPWNDEQIAAEHKRDKAAKARYFGTSDEPAKARGIWPTILRWFSKLK